jgi:uncharacterized protein YjiS (DUF1127 family)
MKPVPSADSPTNTTRRKSGESYRSRGDRVSNVSRQNNAAKVADIGLTRKQIHEARAVRDAALF